MFDGDFNHSLLFIPLLIIVISSPLIFISLIFSGKYIIIKDLQCDYILINVNILFLLSLLWNYLEVLITKIFSNLLNEVLHIFLVLSSYCRNVYMRNFT